MKPDEIPMDEPDNRRQEQDERQQWESLDESVRKMNKEYLEMKLGLDKSNKTLWDEMKTIVGGNHAEK